MGISADSPAESRALAEDRDISFPLASDPTLAVITAYGVAMAGEDIAVPAVFLVSPEGAILWRHVGENMTDRPLTQVIVAHARDWARGRW